MVGYLLKICFKTVCLEKQPVVRRIILHAKSRLTESIDQESPKIIVLAKVDWPVHGVHPILA